MKILQTRNKKWYLDKRHFVTPTRNLKDAILCDEVLDYSTMNLTHMVMESYEEMFEQLMLCYVAFIRFYDLYQYDTKYVWINKDAGSVVLDSIYGRGQFYIGPVPADYYKTVKSEIRNLAGRSIIIEHDWLIRFRDSLVLSCY